MSAATTTHAGESKVAHCLTCQAEVVRITKAHAKGKSCGAGCSIAATRGRR